MLCSKCGSKSPEYANLCCVCGNTFTRAHGAISDSSILQKLAGSGDKHLLADKAIGSYKIIKVIGKGGMAFVYYARHKDLMQPRALKIMRDECAESPTLVARFLNEARAAAAIDHPNIVRVFDAGTFENNLYYIAMEFVKGYNIADILLKTGPVKWRKCLEVVTQVLSALEVAHSLGIIHRDIKPGNIMLAEKMHVKLADFGYALTPDDNLPRTDNNEVLGTPEVMSPEQITGGAVDRRTDIYGLGATMYNMITGEPLFSASSVSGLFDKHLKSPPPAIRDSVPAVPEWLSDMCLKMVSKDPAQRHNNVQEIQGVIKQNL